MGQVFVCILGPLSWPSFPAVFAFESLSVPCHCLGSHPCHFWYRPCNCLLPGPLQLVSLLNPAAHHQTNLPKKPLAGGHPACSRAFFDLLWTVAFSRVLLLVVLGWRPWRQAPWFDLHSILRNLSQYLKFGEFIHWNADLKKRRCGYSGLFFPCAGWVS